MSRDDDRVSRMLGGSHRRKMRNLRSLIPAGGSVVSLTDDSDDDGGLPDDGVDRTCGGRLLGCHADAEAEVCSPNDSGAWQQSLGCTLDVLSVGLETGDPVAWAADVKVSAAAGEEVNGTGTLKKTPGLLLRDPLDTLANVTIENGDAGIVNDKLHLPDGTKNDVRFTGVSARSEVVAQIRLQGDADPTNWVLARFAARATASLDAYGGMYSKFQDALDRFVGGLFDAQLDTENYVGGAQRLSSERTVCKIYTADGVQRLKMSTSATDQTYQMSAADTALDGQTGVPAFISGSTSHPTTAWDLIVCPSDRITCTGLPTGYSIRVGVLSATESGGTATLDLEGTLYPAAFPLEVLDDLGDVVEAWQPPSGIFGGDAFEFDELGGLGGDPEFDATGQIDLAFYDTLGILLDTATSPTTISTTYTRLGGTATLPAGTQFITPILRRAGTAPAVVCGRRVAVVAGTAAPGWDPCEEIDDPARQITDRGKVILNPEFNEVAPGGGSYWATHPESTGTPDSENPTLGDGVDFAFSGDGEIVNFLQVLNADDDFTKAPGSEGIEASGGGSTEPDVEVSGVPPVLRIRGDNITGLGDGASVTTQFKNIITDTSSAVFNGDPKYVADAFNGHAGVRFERATPDILQWGLSYFPSGLVLMVYIAEDDPSAEVCVVSLTDGATRNNWLHRLDSLQSYGMRYRNEGAKAANGSTAQYDPNLTIQGAYRSSGITEYAYDGQAKQEVDGWIGADFVNFDKVHVGGSESVAAGAHFDGVILEVLVWDGSFGSVADHAEITRLMGELDDYYNNVAVPPLSGAGTRLFPVTNEDVLVFAAEFIKDAPADGTALELYVREYDDRKVQFGGDIPILEWLAAEDGSRRQKVHEVGSTQAGDLKYEIAYISFHGRATGDTGETSHLEYWWGWVRPARFDMNAIVEVDGSDLVNFDWEAHIPTRIKYVANTTGFVNAAEVEENGTFPVSTEAYSGTVSNVLGGALGGSVAYISIVPYDRDSKRSGEIVYIRT